MKDWEPDDPKAELLAQLEATFLSVLMICAAGGVIMYLLGT